MAIAVWNNLSVKHKLFGLVLLPISLLLFLVGRQSYILTTQLTDFKRTNQLSIYLQDISVLYRNTLASSPEEFTEQYEQVNSKLKKLSPIIFLGASDEINQLIADFSEATLSTMEARDPYDKLDAQEWQSDLYEQLLLQIERVPFENTKRNLGLTKTPIIALTASVIDNDIQKCFDSGMDGYVAKPVRREKLLHQIKSATC